MRASLVRAVVDVAGGRIGGAARYRSELLAYLSQTQPAHRPRVLGLDQHLTPAWLMRRELAAVGASRKIATNNASFVSPGGARWVLVRNILHFLRPSEAASLGPRAPRGLAAQAAVVRVTLRRADVVVAPSAAMAEHVTDAVPCTSERIAVRAHPVSPDSVPIRRSSATAILCPVVFSAYKRMDEHVLLLLHGLDKCERRDRAVLLTAGPAEVSAEIARDPRVRLLGRLSHQRLRHHWSEAAAIFYPSGFESFGYPLAEARVSGRPVIAQDSPLNREIARQALRPFRPGDVTSMQEALSDLESAPSPEPAAFAPRTYFEWLLDDGGR